MTSNVKICERCILKSTMPGVDFNQDGICSECLDYDKRHRSGTQNIKEKAHRKMLRMIKRAQKRSCTAHVLIELSGGKDSAYLAYLLKHVYRMNILAITVLHPLISNAARRNARRVVRCLGIDHVEHRVDEEMFKRLVREGIKLTKLSELGPVFGYVACSHIYHAVTYNVAIERSIPLVASGLDQGQCELPVMVEKSRVKDFLKWYFADSGYIFRRIFGTQFRKSPYDTSFARFDAEMLPEVIFPLSCIDCEAEHVMYTLSSCGVADEKYNPLLTNTDAIPFFDYLSFRDYDCDSYVRHYARQIRRYGLASHKTLFTRDLERKELLRFLDERKAIVNDYARTSRTVRRSLDLFSKKYPLHTDIMGRKNCALFMKKLGKIRYYADYFSIAI